MDFFVDCRILLRDIGEGLERRFTNDANTEFNSAKKLSDYIGVLTRLAFLMAIMATLGPISESIQAAMGDKWGGWLAWFTNVFSWATCVYGWVCVLWMSAAFASYNFRMLDDWLENNWESDRSSWSFFIAQVVVQIAMLMALGGMLLMTFGAALYGTAPA